MRNVARVTLKNRNADALAAGLAHESFEVAVTRDHEAAVRAADIVCAATLDRCVG
jgi:ornithine cyclodeaminase/alanine dehydrogenase-like protein (mu-crystallin family)